MTSKINSRNIANCIGELKLVIVSQRSELAMQNKFNYGPTEYSNVKVNAKYLVLK